MLEEPAVLHPFLYVRKGNSKPQIIYGGTGVNSEDVEMPSGSPERYEVGTSPLPAIVSMHAGAGWLQSVGIDKAIRKNSHLRSLMVSLLEDVPGVSLHGASGVENTGIVALTTDSYTPQEFNMALDIKGFCVRSGLHCAPLAHKALGTFPQGVVRASLSWFCDEEHVRAFVSRVQALLE